MYIYIEKEIEIDRYRYRYSEEYRQGGAGRPVLGGVGRGPDARRRGVRGDYNES